MALNLGEMIRLFDEKDVGADVPIKINKNSGIYAAISELDHEICDTKTDKEYAIFKDNKNFKNLVYACGLDCYNTAVMKVVYVNNEVTLEVQDGGGGNSRFDDWRGMLRPLIDLDNGRIVVVNTRDNLQVVPKRLIDALPDGEVEDWHIGKDGIFYVGVNMRIVNQKLIEDITKYNNKFDQFEGNGGQRLLTQMSFNVTGNRDLIGKIEEIIENNQVGEYRKYNFCGIFTYKDTNNFSNIQGIMEQEQIRLIEKSLRAKHPEVLGEIEIQQIIWADNEKKAVQFRCRSLQKDYIDAPFDLYLKLSQAGYFTRETRNMPIAIGDLNARKWYLKMYE